eukprot:CAMPEP_0197920300 /NCGR_PEP_ID=MMETSP1439-20131203/88736_1 /TAXON_ID=66791 /ORGANISM="Gonyaulax spinifera, Strain CCMP409" /LENGTH=61 /DNA_ID=CAMNT_0043542495 /DNA_START=173 /DNA_END=358 /DNA_ORIENTATION=+
MFQSFFAKLNRYVLVISVLACALLAAADPWLHIPPGVEEALVLFLVLPVAIWGQRLRSSER